MKKEVEIKHLPMEEKKELVRRGKMHWFFPDHVVEQVVICIIIVVALVSLATLYPPKLDEMADPFSTPEHIKPEWYFLPAYQELKIAEKLGFLGAWAPKVIGMALQGAAIGFLFVIPFLDRNPERAYAKRRFAIAAGILSVIGTILLGLWGHLS